jgi:chromate transporter
VILGVVFLSPEVVGAPLIPIRRAVGIAVVGLLFGNAFLQMTSSKVTGRKKLIGIGITVAVAVATIAGAHLLIAATAGFIVGVFLMRPDEETSK